MRVNGAVPTEMTIHTCRVSGTVTQTSDELTAVELPAEVVERVDARLPRTEFDSADAYVAYVLEEVLARVESETDDDFATADEAQVRDRLESLGYLDS